MKIYLAGPMTGIPKFNVPAFEMAEAYLVELGHEVFAPHKTKLSKDLQNDLVPEECLAETHRAVIGEDLIYIVFQAEAIAFLPGWENSAGAMAEFFTAKYCKLPMIFLKAEDYVKQNN